MLNKILICFALVSWSLLSQAGVREPSSGNGSGQMVAKLQAMMRAVTKERDALKTENAKLQADIKGLTKKNASLEITGEKVSKKLANQQSNNNKLKIRQEQTYNKLVEVVDKYKVLKQEKNQLQLDLKNVQGEYQNSSEQLKLCGNHNSKLVSSAKELLERYQNKGTFDGFLQTEGVLQFKSVEMENIVQEYEDKINAEVYTESVSLNK